METYQGAGVLLFQGDKVLLGKRSFFPANVWTIPAGGLEKKEKQYAHLPHWHRIAALREFMEETHITKKELLQFDYLGERSIKLPFFNFFTLILVAPMKMRLTVKANYEFADLKFFSITDLPQPLFPLLKSTIYQSLRLMPYSLQDVVPVNLIPDLRFYEKRKRKGRFYGSNTTYLIPKHFLQVEREFNRG